MLKNKFYQAWDPRVFERWIQYGLRELPTRLYPESESTATAAKPKEVTLTTSKHHEVMTFIRGNFPHREGDKEASSSEYSFSNPTAINRRTHPDLSPGPNPQAPFYRGESMIVFQQLPNLRPSVLYVFGSTSFLTTDPINIDEKMELTGSGVGGSGGVKEGRVSQVMVQDAGHLIPMEKVEETASYAATWVGQEISRWRAHEQLTEAEWGSLKGIERSVIPDRFQEELVRAIKGDGAPQGKGAKL